MSLKGKGPQIEKNCMNGRSGCCARKAAPVCTGAGKVCSYRRLDEFAASYSSGALHSCIARLRFASRFHFQQAD